MHGAHGKLALPVVGVAPKGGTEPICLLYMVALIVQEITLKTKLATLIPVQVLLPAATLWLFLNL